MINNLKNLRLNNNETQENLADLLNLTVSDYSDKENGLVSIKNYEKKLLANHFHTSIENISGEIDTI